MIRSKLVRGLIALFAISTLSTILSSRDAWAGPELQCEMCNYDFNASRHSFDGSVCTMSVPWGQDGCANCTSAKPCHRGTMVGICSLSHDRCGGEVARAEEAVRQALEEVEFATVAFSLPTRMDAVVVTDDGYALVIDCTGQVAAAYLISVGGHTVS
jgi:hypothetical protein